MKHLLGFLLLSSLYSLSSWGISVVLVVTQSPDRAVTEGEVVQIQCCWNVNFTRATINWLRDHKAYSKWKTTILVSNNKCQGEVSKPTAVCNCSNLTISNITKNDSGTYICEMSIELPQLMQSEGNGTHLTVTDRDNTNNSTPDTWDWEDVVIYIFRCLPFLSLLMALFYLSRGRKKPQRPRQAALEDAPPLERQRREGEEENLKKRGGCDMVEDEVKPGMDGQEETEKDKDEEEAEKQ